MKWKLIALLLSLSAARSVFADTSFGYYSNVTSLSGELSGIEFLVVNNGRAGSCDKSVLVQTFEGWPQQAELLDCCQCNSKQIRFKSPKLGTFVGALDTSGLEGQFLESNYQVTAPKGLSIWQRLP